MPKKTDAVRIEVHVKHMTREPNGKKEPRAYLVSNGKKDAWIPASAVIDSDDELEIGKHTTIEISTELAEDKELV